MSAHSEAANGFVVSEKALLLLDTLPEQARRNIIGRAYEIFFADSGATPLPSEAEERGAKSIAFMALQISTKLKKRQEQSRSARAVGISRLSRDISHDHRETTAKESGEESTPPIPPTKEEGKENNIILSALAHKRKVFIPPTVDEVRAYCTERNNGINADNFVDFYAGKGWFVGKNKMVDWRAAVRTWERNRNNATVRSATYRETCRRNITAGNFRAGTEAQRDEASSVL